jgi:hypothetical protein
MEVEWQAVDLIHVAENGSHSKVRYERGNEAVSALKGW